jgi:hypothetical protein
MAKVSKAEKINRREGDLASLRIAQAHAFRGDERRAITAESSGDIEHRWSQRHHAAARAGQRFGVAVDVGHFVEIGARIATGERVQPGLMLIGHVIGDRLDRRTSAWLVWIDGRPMPIIYDHDTRAVVTVLPWTSAAIRFEGGSFIHLANGGTKAARSVWNEVRS